MVQIAPMSITDIPSVLQIERYSHSHPWTQRFFEEELCRPFSHAHVARLSNESSTVVGYVCYWNVADEIQILNLAVHPEYRQRHIGRSLLLHALVEGCGLEARIALLEVGRDNEAAQHLYKSIGFRIVGQRPSYYEEGPRGAAILMRLDMDQDWRSRWLNPIPEGFYAHHGCQQYR